MLAMQTLWHDLAAFTGQWWVDPVFRPIVVYLFLIVALRLAGKRLLAQMNAFDLVVLLILSNTLQNAILGDDTSWQGGLVRASTLLVVNALLVRTALRHRRVDEAVEGRPDRLIVGGAVQYDALRKEGITDAELRVAAHKQGFESLAEIENAEIDPGGIVCFERRHATDDHAQHQALLARLDRIERLLEGPDRPGRV